MDYDYLSLQPRDSLRLHEIAAWTTFCWPPGGAGPVSPSRTEEFETSSRRELSEVGMNPTFTVWEKWWFASTRSKDKSYTPWN